MKLYFRYGSMNSSKTANLLMVTHNYEMQDKKVLLIKPKLDVRFGNNTINSRSGLEKKADIIADSSTDLEKEILKTNINYDCILIDEVQFLTEKHIDELRNITKYTPVICYGLRSDYKTNLFPASKRLMELADSIEEIKTVCNFCNKKATINMKYINGKKIIQGNDEPDLGSEEKYLGVCWFCYDKL